VSILSRMLRRAALATLTVAAFAAPAQAATYYVSPSGHDASSGRSPGHAWRTLKKVDETRLAPGDTVLLEGGARFADSPLIPPASGRPGAPITFSSYGTGRPNLPRGIWFDSRSHLVFDNLAVDPGPGAHRGAGLQSSRGAGSRDVVVRRSAFTHLAIGILVSNPRDSGWTIERNTISHTGDSGVITVGHDLAFVGNTILDTGEDASIPYGKHGVYAKGPNLTFRDNVIRRFSADGISLRYHDATVVGNEISDGPIGIAWFQNDPSGTGTTRILANRISATRDSGIYVSPEDAAGSTRESFVISGNAIAPAGGNAIDVQRTSGDVSLTGNTLRGPYAAQHVERPGGRLAL
jgi:Right handed beta helix region